MRLDLLDFIQKQRGPFFGPLGEFTLPFVTMSTSERRNIVVPHLHLTRSQLIRSDVRRVRGIFLGELVWALIRVGKGRFFLTFRGSYLGQFPLVSAHLWTSDHLSSSSRAVHAFL